MIKKIGAALATLALILAGASPAHAAAGDRTAGMRPAGVVAGKGFPGLASTGARLAPSCGPYSYAAGSQTMPAGTTVAGVAANYTVAKPFLNTATACHTLAEAAVQSADLKQIVEVGWNVDQVVNGDLEPHLFVYHWVNGSPSCYNGCGWVDNGSNPVNAGASLSAVRAAAFPGNVKKFVILHDTSTSCGSSAAGWWAGYDNTWLGCFPDALWTAPAFTTGSVVQLFGEVSSVGVNDCTDMGLLGRQGSAGTAPLDAADPAYISSATLSGVTPAGTTANLTTFTAGGTGYSVLGFPGGTPPVTRTLTYGGPGPGGVAGAC